MTANRTGARQATEALLRHYRRVAVVSAFPRSSPSRERIAGYEEAMAAAGLEPVAAIRPQDRGREGVRAQVKRLLTRLEKPFGLFCTTNASLLGAVMELKEAGLSWPNDVGLIGFGDADWNRVIEPPISVVRTFPERIGQIAVDELIRVLEGGKPLPGLREVAGELVERASSRPA